MPQHDRPLRFARLGILADLTEEQQSALEAELTPMAISRGDVLVRQGEEADALFIVISGRFDVRVDGRAEAVAEIGPGSPVGEIAFLAGGQRTATVTAVRDSLVVRLDRDHFDRLCQRTPQIWGTLTVSLARRLADQTAGRAPQAAVVPRTIAVIRAGGEPVPSHFVSHLASAFQRMGRTAVIDSGNVAAATGGHPLDSGAATEALNALEGSHSTVIYVADPLLTAWSEKAIRQADLVLRVGLVTRDASVAVSENVLEAFAAKLLSPAAQRLVLLYPQRRGPQGTRYWLEPRKVGMHHHVALDGHTEIDRLVRFISGRARGIVACGGGAFCAAHVGLFKALNEADVSFDVMGGTSGGSAMTAGFAMGQSPEDIDRMVHEIFVRQKALRRYTWPRFAILDHVHFDRLLEDCFGGVDIEDLWLPFFAVSTNLSRYAPHRHTRGSLWEAIRASSSIPALLPPFYTRDGEMLVDRALVHNSPVRVMRDFKSGPNVVVSFETPQLERFAVDYRALPSRGAFIRQALLPFSRRAIPNAPSLGTVLMRSLIATRNEFERHLQESDLLMVPPVPAGMSILDWGRHSELMSDAYQWGREEIERALARHHPAVESFSARDAIVKARRKLSNREQM